MQIRLSRVALLGLSLAAMTLAMQTPRAQETEGDQASNHLQSVALSPAADPSPGADANAPEVVPSGAADAAIPTAAEQPAPSQAHAPLVEAPEPALPVALEPAATNPPPAPATVAATPAQAPVEDLVGAMKQALEAYAREHLRWTRRVRLLRRPGPCAPLVRKGRLDQRGEGGAGATRTCP